MACGRVQTIGHMDDAARPERFVMERFVMNHSLFNHPNHNHETRGIAPVRYSTYNTYH